jgi:HEPN domain-containing protein
MPDSRNPLSWAAFAEEDYQTAMDILEKHPRNAVYCFEQAAEKYLKALLIRDAVAPRSHDLPQLLLLIDPEFDLQSRVMKAAQLLT